MRTVGLFSGGKDSLTACYYEGVKEVVYCKTGIGLNFEYVLKMCNKLGWKLHVVEPAKHQTYEKFIEKFSFPHYFVHGAVMRYLKTGPLRKWWIDQGRDILFISGRRKNESEKRKRMKSNTKHSKLDGMNFYSPIFDWSTPMVYDYLKKEKLELSPTYETMHMSGDCFCGAFSRRGESFLLKVFHKELAAKIEDLEDKYGGHWGNYTSMKAVKNQTTLDNLICMDCVNQ